MKNDSTAHRRRGLWLSLTTLGLIGTLIGAVPFQSLQHAAAQSNDELQITRSYNADFSNYDVRLDKNAAQQVASFRVSSGKNAAAIATERQKSFAGENALRQRISSLKIERSQELGIAEVIGPDVSRGKAVLSDATGAKRSDTLRNFIKGNSDLIGVTAAQADELVVTSDYTNPNGILSFASLEQRINNVPVFMGEIKAGFDRQNRMFRVINDLAPGLDSQSLSNNFGNPETAVQAAFKNVSRQIKAEDVQPNAAASTDLKVTFGGGDNATTAEKMYFPVDTGVARAAWRVLIWEDVAAYLVIVDAETGALLWRKNITSDQTQAATYNVYANSTSMVKSLDSPAPITPGPLSPTLGTQGVQVARTNITLIGNEAPNTFNNLGWITDGANGVNGLTDGNNVEAGLDIVAPDGVDAPTVGTNRVFNFAYNPPPGLGGTPPDAVTTPDSRNGAVTQLFYFINRYHDETYKLGFTEAARNFQNDNFGRGGLGGDRVRGEAQDFSGTNNANFSPPPDGNRGRMQMYRFTQTPNRDGDLDGDIVLHEFTHGLSNRLHGNSSGLSNAVSGSMGEGWSDFYAFALLSEPTDPVNAIYTTGAYATFNSFGIGTSNSYYGIRRFPYALLSLTGGPNNRPHNPLTFKDIDPAQANLSDGAYAPSPPFAGNPANEVHNAGEVWCSALVEVRAKLIASAGGNVAAGNLKVLQFVTDGMKLAPPGPNFLQERDAIVSGAQASGTGQDVADIWAGFAVRGMGFSATQGNASFAVTEGYDLPNVVQTPTFTVTDAAGNNNGYPEPGETLVLSVPLSNSSGETITGVTLQLVGGGSADYGDIAYGATVSRNITYTVPAGTPCGSLLTLTFNLNSSRGASTVTRQIRIGVPTFAGGSTQNFDGVTAPALPTGWTNTFTGATTGWVTSTATTSSPPNALFAADPTTDSSATVETSARVTTSGAQLGFKINYNTEATYDGTALSIKVGNGPWQDILAAGGTFVSGGYNGTFTGRPGWTGNSGGYVNVLVNLPAATNGQVVGIRFETTSDESVSGAGTYIDDVQLTGGTFFSSFACGPVTPTGPTNSRADFDGDGKTDLSVFRAGAWYVQRSTAGFVGVQFGAATDVTVPGDYDGDNKTDYAVFRPNASAGASAFYMLNGATGTFSSVQWGVQGDIPVVGDYNGDNRDDVAVVRPSTYTWYILPSGGGALISGSVGQVCDRPVVGDFDGDGKTDIAGIQGGTWFIRNSITNVVTSTQWGLSSDKFVPADYDNDNKDDLAVFRDGNWYVRRSSNGQLLSLSFGQTGDVAVPGDYDGDGADDVAVFRNGSWYINGTTSGFQSFSFGTTGDTAIPNRYLPQ